MTRFRRSLSLFFTSSMAIGCNAMLGIEELDATTGAAGQAGAGGGMNTGGQVNMGGKGGNPGMGGGPPGGAGGGPAGAPAAGMGGGAPLGGMAGMGGGASLGGMAGMGGGASLGGMAGMPMGGMAGMTTCLCPDGATTSGMVPCRYAPGTVATGGPGVAANAIDGKMATFQSFSTGMAQTTITLTKPEAVRGVEVVWLPMPMQAVTCTFDLYSAGNKIATQVATAQTMNMMPNFTTVVAQVGVPTTEIQLQVSCGAGATTISMDEISPIISCP